MGRFLIFVGTVLILSIIGLCVWWLWSKVNMSIQKRNSDFETEKESRKKEKFKEEENS